MKYNEPIRPFGIGRKQVAFKVGNVPSDTDEDTDLTDYMSNVAIEQGISTLAKAKASAEGTVTSLKQDVQNVAMEITGINDMYFASGSLGVDISWNQGRVVVGSPLYWYNWYDRHVYVKKPGWYAVRVNFFAPEVNAAHEWGIKLISNVTLDSPNYEVYTTYMDYQHTSKHPYVNGFTLFNAPEQVFKSNSGGLPGFKIRLYSTNTNVNFNSYNTYANLQVIRLSDLSYSSRLIL